MSAATDAAYNSLNSYKQLGSNDALEQANQKYDVAGNQTRFSALQGVVNNLQSSVEAVDPSVTGRTTGTFTTEGQRQALVSKEKAPILGDLAKQQQGAQQAQGALNTSQTLASQMASALLSDDKQRYQQLLDQYNASASKDTEDESRRQYEESLAEQKRQFDITAQQNAKAAAVKSSGGAAATKTNTIGELYGDIQANLANYKKQPKMWTEKTLIPQLIAAYPELSAKQVTDAVYQLRKQYE